LVGKETAARQQKDCLTDISQMTSKFVEIVPPFHRQENASLPQPSDGLILEIDLSLEGHLPRFSAIQTHLSRRFYLAVEFPGLRQSGSSSQINNQAQDFLEQTSRHRHLG
jgi:hypothetical protein